MIKFRFTVVNADKVGGSSAVGDGGLGGAVAEIQLEAGIVARFFDRVGLREGFPSIVCTQLYLRAAYSLEAASIARAVVLAKRRLTMASSAWMRCPPLGASEVVPYSQ